jgi:hypothetical protein
MSRSLGLREDQRVGEVLAMRIAGLFPVDSVWCHREQARSHMRAELLHTGCEQHKSLVGARLAREDGRPVTESFRPWAS